MRDVYFIEMLLAVFSPQSINQEKNNGDTVVS